MTGEPSSDTSFRQAFQAWAKLYGGELTDDETATGIAVMAVRHPDFRAARGNWPKIFHHRKPTARVLVLIHGLKDSPGYLEDIALRFATTGITVVLPLLPGHGRRHPVKAMRQAKLAAWRSMVKRTMAIAAALGDEISIGGLSTGGALAIDEFLRDRDAITGKIFLFSAALGFAPVQRLVLSTSLVPRGLDTLLARRPNTGLGGDPLKYSRRFAAAGREVFRLSNEIARRADEEFAGLAGRDRVFVAHSEADQTIPIAAVRPLVDPTDPGQHHIIPAATEVGHAPLVLAKAPTYSRRWPDEPEPPRANPEFEAMMRKALAFLDR